MSNYYKYVKRDEPQLLDWDGVTKTFSDKVMKPIEEERKAKGEAAQLEDQLSAYESQIQTGKTKTQDRFFGNAIQLIGKVNADLANAYKKGQGTISAQEYNIQAQSFKSQYELFKNYQTTYLSKYDEILKTEGAGNIQNALMGTVEGFGKLKNLHLEYTDGNLVLQRIEDDGARNGKPQSLESLTGMTSFRNSKFDQKALDDGKDFLTSMYTTLQGNKTISDPLNNPEFESALDSQVKGILNGDHQVVEYLSGPGGYQDVLFEPFDASKTNTIFMEVDDNGIPKIVEEQRDAVYSAADEKVRSALIGSLPKKITSKNQGGSGAAATTVATNAEFLVNVNNLLTNSNNPGASLGVIANQTGANDIDYITNSSGEVTAYVLKDFTNKKPVQTIDLFDAGNKKSTKKIAEEFYSIYSTDAQGKTISKRGEFQKAWGKSKISSTENYSSAQQDVLKMDQGDRKQDIKIGIAGTAIALPPNEYLEKKPGDYVGLYNGSFKSKSKAGYVPKMYQGQANIKDSGNDIKITLGKRTKFRHDPLKISIPKNISDSEHILVQEAIQNVLWDNPNIKKSGELLGLLDEEVDKLMPNNTIDFQ